MSAISFFLSVAAVFANETAALQSLVDSASEAGGGVVRIPSGSHMVASLRLKSGVTLLLEDGARLVGSTNYADYVTAPGDNRGAVVWSDSARDVAIVGNGVIDGRGGLAPHVCGIPGRWRGVALYRTKGVRIEGVEIRDAHSWACYLCNCEDVVVRGLRIENHVNYNNDGLDIEASNVLVEDCCIDSEDDGIVFKARTPESRVENVVVRNCRVFSNSSAIKVGTESRGRFSNITVSNCTVGVRRPISVRDDYAGVPGVTNRMTGLAAIDVSVVDGGSLEGFRVSDVSIGGGFLVPFFLRHGRRDVSSRESFFRDVLIERVRMTGCAASRMPSAVTGVAAFNWADLSSWWNLSTPWNWKAMKSLRPSNVVFRDVSVLLPADCDEDSVYWMVPERADVYPAAFMFGPSLLPSSAFYVRHADGVVLDGVEVRRAGGPRRRRAIVADDAEVGLVNVKEVDL